MHSDLGEESGMEKNLFKKIIYNFIVEAIVVGDQEELAQWLSIIPANAETLSALLSYAIYFNEPKLVTLLLEKGANVNHCDKQGNTGLSIAVRLGYLEVVEALLKHSVETINQTNHAGFAPIHFAAINYDWDMHLVLMKAGANSEILIKEGLNILDIFLMYCDRADSFLFSEIKASIEKHKEWLSSKKSMIQHKSNFNRKNLLPIIAQLKTASKEDKQSLLKQLLILEHDKESAEEWLDILKCMVPYLLALGAKINHEIFYIAIVNGLPILDKLLASVSNPDEFVNYCDFSNKRYLDTAISHLELFSNPSQPDFINSKDYAWRVENIAQLLLHTTLPRHLSPINLSHISAKYNALVFEKYGEKSYPDASKLRV
jgi:hypothetical protein